MADLTTEEIAEARRFIEGTQPFFYSHKQLLAWGLLPALLDKAERCATAEAGLAKTARVVRAAKVREANSEHDRYCDCSEWCVCGHTELTEALRALDGDKGATRATRRRRSHPTTC